jgi:hypothetical protein
MNMTIKTLRETVAEQVAAISPEVETKVVDHFVAAETRKRADAIIKGMDDLAALQKERPRLAKGTTLYNADRTVASETFTQQMLDGLEKHDKKIEKLTRALDKAIAGDMGDLLNIGKGGDKPAATEE